MSAATAQRWQLVEEAGCTICGDEAQVADTRVELADGTRVRVCQDCAESLAVVHKLDSRAAAGILEQARREQAALEQMLAQREGELSEQASQVETLRAELERLRAEAERRQQAIGRIVAAAQELA